MNEHLNKDIDFIVIVGPTASGKTNLAIKIAKKYGGEIISADSRATYSLLNIGTAKPNLNERDGVPHWGFDLAGPGQRLSVADFKRYADKKLKEIKQRGYLPILVGGSGLYIDSVVYNFNFAPANEKLRQVLSNKTIDELQQEIRKLKLKMPENSQNKRYLIRTLERSRSPLRKHSLTPGTIIIGLNPDKQILKRQIIKRAQQMLKSGVVNEIKQVAKEYGWNSEAMTAGIYKVFKPFIEGKISQKQALEAIIASDMRLVKKQTTWFRRNDDIRWFNSAIQASNWLDKQIRGKL